MKYTLLLCTLDRQKELDFCLKSLMNQTYENFEIIVVDQSEGDYSQKYGSIQKLRYIHITEKGLSNARNVGLGVANSDYTCLIDDDAVYPLDWLEKVNSVLSTSEMDFLCGYLEDPNTHRKSVPTRYLKRVDVKFKKAMVYCISPACVVKTSYLQLMRFDERFGVGRQWGAGEETDLVWRLIYKKARVVFDPSIVVFHKVAPKSDLPEDKLYKYNVGFGALFKKHLLEYPSIDVLLFIVCSIGRNIAGIIVYWIKKDKLNQIRQRICLTGKLAGLKEYRENH